MRARASTGGFALLLAAVALLALPAGGGAAPPATGAAAGAVAGVVPFDHWATFHGSENRSGYTPYSGPMTLQHDWYRCLGAAHLRLGPVLDGQHLYLADDLGNVYAVDLGDNQTVAWTLDVYGEPVQMDLSGGSLYVGTVSGGLFDLASSNGTVLWRLALPAGVVQGVAVANGLVLVGTTAGDVTAFDAATGSEAWTAHLGAAIAGAVAIEGGTAYAVTRTGRLAALSLSGAVEWSTDLGGGMATSVAVSDGLVVASTLTGNVTAVRASTGAPDWSWSSRSTGTADVGHATPALGDGLAVALMDSGSVYALSLANGSLDWATPSIYSGLPAVGPPAITPTGIYLAENGIEAVEMLTVGNGSVAWTDFPGTFSFAPPAVDGGHLFLGLDNGCVAAWGPTGLPRAWTVQGEVVDPNGSPIVGAYVLAGALTNYTDATGRFALDLANGSYEIDAYDLGKAPGHVSVTVTGPVSGITIVLEPLTVFPLTGVVEDASSGRGVANATVLVVGALGYSTTTTTGPDGAFVLPCPNGTANLSVALAGYAPSTLRVRVDGVAVPGLVLRVHPNALDLGERDSLGLRVALPLAAVSTASVGFGAWEARRRRVARGLGPDLLSPFGRFVAMRAILVPVQVLVLLAGVYSVGSVLPAAARHESPCVLVTGACAPCPTWASGCGASAVANGFGNFATHLFTGQWGWAGFGALREPVTQFLAWWLPDSVELGLVSVALAFAIGYPLALYAGGRRGSVTDPVARVGSLIGLVIPSVFVALAVVLLAGPAFDRALGDFPYGTLPSLEWFRTHGGSPAWVGFGSNTTPTGLPLVDGALHSDWPFEAVVLAKTLLQAAIVAIIYLGVFFRHAYSVAVESARAPSVVAARARGVPERTLLWRHAHRRTLPVVVLVLGLTLPAFLGTQALVEALFSDQGMGTILLIEVANLRGEPPGFTGPTTGNFYQVMVFLVAFFLLLSTLFADVLARYLDPRLQRGDA